MTPPLRLDALKDGSLAIKGEASFAALSRRAGKPAAGVPFQFAG
jgi:hypothetical protein